ncbi:hypothetical protein HMPREF9420_0493 [Segatella salivae DSM 15606]|uniref:Uncharacterized protein n=1 Tax=Segatella salivae DSM 15606 TaxID=888832 RepID=E6MLX6_9BACT|nr:hypothetical protein HMPREF9420_0493 [Segatella salivae DSM 15606]
MDSNKTENNRKKRTISVQHNVKSIQSIYASLSIIYNILTKRFRDK